VHNSKKAIFFHQINPIAKHLNSKDLKGSFQTQVKSMSLKLKHFRERGGAFDIAKLYSSQELEQELNKVMVKAKMSSVT
jgi:hypothetical protein